MTLVSSPKTEGTAKPTTSRVARARGLAIHIMLTEIERTQAENQERKVKERKREGKEKSSLNIYLARLSESRRGRMGALRMVPTVGRQSTGGRCFVCMHTVDNRGQMLTAAHLCDQRLAEVRTQMVITCHTHRWTASITAEPTLGHLVSSMSRHSSLKNSLASHPKKADTHREQERQPSYDRNKGLNDGEIVCAKGTRTGT